MRYNRVVVFRSRSQIGVGECWRRIARAEADREPILAGRDARKQTRQRR